MEEATQPKADQKQVFFCNVSKGEDQGPEGRAVCEVAVVVVPAVVDKVEPEHVDIGKDRTENHARKQSIGGPVPA